MYIIILSFLYILLNYLVYVYITILSGRIPPLLPTVASITDRATGRQVGNLVASNGYTQIL